jgi:hypothetical protein
MHCLLRIMRKLMPLVLDAVLLQRFRGAIFFIPS